MIDPKDWFRIPVYADGEGFACDFTCPEDLPYLDGHFPNQPIMPAVAMIDASIEMIRGTDVGRGFNLAQLDAAKYTGPITPGMTVHIRLIAESAERWRIIWKHGEQVLAELRLTSV